ncbi:MAG: ACT domain-containing protein [Pseudomonadota bacterium]
MSQLLVISAMGQDRAGVVHEVAEVIRRNEGNILESRMATLGSEFAMLLLVSGHWHTISKLEAALETLATASELSITIRQTRHKPAGEPLIPYAVDVICLDQEGIVSDVSGFLASRGVEIAELSTRSYPAAHTGAPMFSIQATVSIPGSLSIAQMREEFLQFCDHMNIDGILEPIKT